MSAGNQGQVLAHRRLSPTGKRRRGARWLERALGCHRRYKLSFTTLGDHDGPRTRHIHTMTRTDVISVLCVLYTICRCILVYVWSQCCPSAQRRMCTTRCMSGTHVSVIPHRSARARCAHVSHKAPYSTGWPSVPVVCSRKRADML